MGCSERVQDRLEEAQVTIKPVPADRGQWPVGRAPSPGSGVPEICALGNSLHSWVSPSRGKEVSGGQVSWQAPPGSRNEAGETLGSGQLRVRGRKPAVVAAERAAETRMPMLSMIYILCVHSRAV